MMTKRCSKCGEVKSLDDFHRDRKKKDGRRSECVDCFSLRQKSLNNDVNYVLRHMAYGVLWRTSRPAHKCLATYAEKQIECRIGSNAKEVRAYISEHFKDDVVQLLASGKRPSLDRVDPNGHYEHGNLRVIDKVENGLAGLENAHKKIRIPVRAVYENGKVEDFLSVADAAKHIGCVDATIHAAIRESRPLRSGVRFELLEKTGE